ncbi:hypothetical protein EV702DRAFT_1244057 [Suillus placidus]|uniref:U3 small nucleolar RNA-associated protein 20 C-terminal domain-containing protein n=1 Tax=Suillus placidus TaxID=48579 RepID=A0A9P6ZN52_9AGAM|nr:hypothetical protein EV702DRAFT_1244057 [Suillus placidus]
MVSQDEGFTSEASSDHVLNFNAPLEAQSKPTSAVSRDIRVYYVPSNPFIGHDAIRPSHERPPSTNMTVERPSSASDSSSESGMADNETEPEYQSEASALSAPAPKKKCTCTLTTPHQSAVLHTFLTQSRFPTTKLRAVAVQVYRLIIDALQREASPHATPLFADVQQILDDSVQSPFSAHLGMLLMKEKLCTQLKSSNLVAPLGLQIVKNLFFVGKLFCTVPSSPPSGSNTNDTAETDSDGGKCSQDPLPWLFFKLSYLARSAHIAQQNRGNTSNKSTWSLAPLSTMRFFAAMASHMEGTQLEQFLSHILTPVYRTMEDDTIRDGRMEELKVTATELLDLLQNKVGMTIFANTYNRVRQGASSKKDKWREPRKWATTNPEAAAKCKLA